MLEVARIDRINSAEDHWVNLLKTEQRLVRGIALICNRVANFHLSRAFDIGDKITDIARFESWLDKHLGCKHAYFLDLVTRIIAHQSDGLARFHFPGNHAHLPDHPAITVEHRIENESAQDFV